MNKIILLALLGLLSSAGVSYSQTQSQGVEYCYDYAGNRISRRIVPLTNPSSVKKRHDPEPVEDQIGDRKITVYPNPTKGMLAVEITGYDEKEAMSVSLYDIQGKLLQKITVKKGRNPIDMAFCQNGSYILRVQAGEKGKEFKIIKE